MRAVLLAAALVVCASATGCHQMGRRHGDPCNACGPTGHHHGGVLGHRKHGGGLFRKHSDMCDVCAATDVQGPFGAPSGPHGPSDALGGVYGPHAAAAAAAGYGGGAGGGPAFGGGPGNYPVRGTPGYPHHHYSREYIGPQGPSTAQVGYPYYTVRGPRDFLQDNPPSIGR